MATHPSQQTATSRPAPNTAVQNDLATRPATEWRTTQRTYPAVRGTNQLAVTPEEFDESLQAYAAFRNRDMLDALKELVRVVGGTLQGYGILEAPMKTAEAAIRKAEGR